MSEIISKYKNLKEHNIESYIKKYGMLEEKWRLLW